MREILFRGKPMDENEWIYGGALHQTDSYGDKVDSWFIIDGTETNDYDIGEPIRVIPETIGQYTGLTDKNGVKIFEGDIMRLCSATHPCIVYWDGRGWAWRMNGKRREIDLTRERMEVIGNIHDNPELVEGLL